MEILNYITDNALILIPALMFIGWIIKDLTIIPDKFIPLLLLMIGIPVSMALLGWSIDGAVQGVLVTGTAVYGNQVWKQLGKKE